MDGCNYLQMATLKQTLKMYLTVSVCAGAATYGYVSYRCRKLREEAMDFDLI
jgi:hypothetical protein